MDDHFKDGIKHPAGKNVAQLTVQLRYASSQAAKHLYVLQCGLYLDLYHVVNKIFITGAFCPTQQQFYWRPMMADAVSYTHLDVYKRQMIAIITRLPYVYK